MGWNGRSAGLLVAAVMVMSVAACTAESDSGGGGNEASCANLYNYQDRSYRDVANVKFTLGKKLGVATQPASCEDTGDRDKSEGPVMTGTAYEVDGISPEIAIAIGDTPKTAAFFAVQSGPELPPEVQKLIDGA
ncbi:DUF6281 family protein [Streptomyces sp. NBC_01013]|uniref:DUF6281 family protein n=1 Tax=Streptomyces sp. NBC_01013 TaxID=2903718 RepID=UPI003868FAE9|nr:DUF6281 family protein [Streptomyces sp. NBC_01013]